MPTVSARLLDGLGRRLGIESHERRLLLLMGALVGTLFCAYTIAKVLRDALFLAEFGALALPYAYIGVALAAVAFVWLESLVAKRFGQAGTARVAQFVAIGFSVVAALVFPYARHLVIVAFYIWTGSQVMMLLPHFWALALDVWDSRRARSVLPLLGGCGLVGGLVGGAFAAWVTPRLRDSGLMLIFSALLVVSSFLSHLVDRHRARRPAPPEAAPTVSRWAIVFRSPYIKTLAVGLALSVVVSTLVDFQFKLFVERAYPDPESLTKFFGAFYVGLNALSLLFQFSVAGWVLQRLGLGPTTGLQPATAIFFTSWILLSPIWWAIVAIRWVQGVVFQTLGKSSAEIYYTAIHPRERRLIKPAIDTLVERWSDAAVGVLLIVLLHTLGVRDIVVAAVTAGLGVVWVAVILLLNRQYGRAFEQALSSRWIEPETTPEAIRTPAARKALVRALHADDERRIVLALRLSRAARDPAITRAVRECLGHASPAVRAAAIGSMQEMRLGDPEGVITGLLTDSNEVLRRAAVDYLLSRTGDATPFARRLLDGDDGALRQYVLDILFDRPYEAPDAITPSWIEARIQSGSREDLLLAARAAGGMKASHRGPWLRTLLEHPDVEVQRAALLSARRRPHRDLIDALIPLFLVPELSHEAREAVAAIGDAAVPRLQRLLDGEEGARPQGLAARTLGRIATPRARGVLMKLVRTADPRLRYLGLESMNRVRQAVGKPVLTRALAHKLFLRELADYRVNIEPAVRLEANAAAEVRLLAASFRESAEMALARALRALSCWYEPKPMAGAMGRLQSREAQAAAPALEFLGHILPRAVFRPVMRLFEGKPANEAGNDPVADAAALDEAVRTAWRLGDGWLRACAVRASRFAPSVDLELFASGAGDHPAVAAELTALTEEKKRRTVILPNVVPAMPAGGLAC